MRRRADARLGAEAITRLPQRRPSDRWPNPVSAARFSERHAVIVFYSIHDQRHAARLGIVGEPPVAEIEYISALCITTSLEEEATHQRLLSVARQACVLVGARKGPLHERYDRTVSAIRAGSTIPSVGSAAVAEHARLVPRPPSFTVVMRANTCSARTKNNNGSRAAFNRSHHTFVRSAEPTADPASPFRGLEERATNNSGPRARPRYIKMPIQDDQYGHRGLKRAVSPRFRFRRMAADTAPPYRLHRGRRAEVAGPTLGG